MGRPRKQIDPRKVEAMAAIGCTAEEIGILLDAKRRTIETRFCVPLKTGQSKLKHTLKRELIAQAKSGNTAALIFATKVYCGLRENPDTVINVSATAVGAQVIFNEETKKQLEDFHVALQRRVFQRVRAPVTSATNGEQAALN